MSFLVTWCLSVDSFFVDLPLSVDVCGFFMWSSPPFANSVYVGLPLYTDSCGFFRRL
jgi:hypothetical protein